METLPTTTYVSPLTGTEYLVVPRTETRMVGDWYKGEPLRPVETTTYQVVLNGNPVQFALTEDGVAESVRYFEDPNYDVRLTSRFD